MNKYLKNLIKKVTGIKKFENSLNSIYKLNMEIYWANLFNSSISNSDWLINKGIKPGRWAANYSFLYLIYNALDILRPKSILEFGLGESSKITMQYANYLNGTRLMIVENDLHWIKHFQKSFESIKYEFIINLPVKNILINNTTANTYEGLVNRMNNNKFDFIIVDGPFSNDMEDNELSRYNIIEIVDNDLIDDDFVIIIDDFNRVTEKNTFNLLLELMNGKKIEYKYNLYEGVKSQVIISSLSYSFITSI